MLNACRAGSMGASLADDVVMGVPVGRPAPATPASARCVRERERESGGEETH